MGLASPPPPPGGIISLSQLTVRAPPPLAERPAREERRTHVFA